MTRLKILGFAALALFAFSAVASSRASALTKAEFLKTGGGTAAGVTFTDKSEASLGVQLATPSLSTTLACTEIISSGKITGPMTVEDTLTCKGAKGKNNKGETCTVKSPGAASEEIKFQPLVGELGEVAKAEATSEVGLNMRPKTGTELFTLEGSCLPISPAKLTGSVAGEPTPTNTLSTTSKVVFDLNGTKQRIKTIYLLPFGTGTTDKPVLVLFISETTLMMTENVKYSEAVELKVG